MRKKIRGLIAMVILLICFSVPAAAATESFHFEQKSPQRAGEMFRFMLFMEEKKFPVKCIHIISSYTQILPDIKQLR